MTYTLNVVNLNWQVQVAVRVLPTATCFVFTSPPCGEVAGEAGGWGRGVGQAAAWLSGGIGPEQLDLRARLFQVAQGGLGGGGRRRFAVDREVEVEPVLEPPAHQPPAVQPRQVDAPLPEAVQRVGQAARPVGGDKRYGTLP